MKGLGRSASFLRKVVQDVASAVEVSAIDEQFHAAVPADRAVEFRRNAGGNEAPARVFGVFNRCERSDASQHVTNPFNARSTFARISSSVPVAAIGSP